MFTMYTRNVCLRALVLVLTITGLAGLTVRTEGQTITTLVDFTNSWRYDQTGRDLGTAWRGNNYTEDSFWQGPGPGLLGFDNNTPYAPFGINTPLTISGSITSYYFRTTFSFSGPTTGMSLIATNFIDDGAVIYLNGTEVGRFRMPANQTALTYASAGPAVEGQYDVLTITNLSRLQQGANLLAVEVHQITVDSSDLVWGMRLLSIRTTALSITNQPQSQTVTVGDPVSISVGVSGGPAFYRWFKDGAAQTSTSNSINIASAQLANAGNYFVIVTNSINSVTSMVATLTVVADTKGPEVIEAVGETNTIPGVPIINMRFSERLTAATATDTNNYVIYVGTNTTSRVAFTIDRYVFIDAPRVFFRMTDTNWIMGSNYFVVVNNVADLKGNNIDPNTRVPVSWQVVTNLTQMADAWMFYDCGNRIFCDPTFPAIYQATTNPWYGTNYVASDPTLWGVGGGIFFFDPNGQGLQCSGDNYNTRISYQDLPTLFRRTFNLPTNYGSRATFKLRYAVDDGMVLYLNGREIHRYNMGPGPYDQNSRASTTITNVLCITNVSVVVTNLLPGTNWLAAGIYQGPIPETDTIFGLEMDSVTLRASPLPSDPPTNQLVLTMTRDGSDKIRLSWPSGFSSYTLQAKGDLVSSSTWLQVSNQSNPFTNVLTGPPRLFRLWNGK